MNKLIDYAGNEIMVEGCPGCAFALKKFTVPSGTVYEEGVLTVSQDWEIPIEGMLVVAPKRHVVNLGELTDQERTRIFDVANKTINALKKVFPGTKYSLVFNESDLHFHVLLVPNHEWMRRIANDPIYNLKAVFDYATNMLKNTREKVQPIADTCDAVRRALAL